MSKQKSQRRKSSTLSREHIVEEAITLLDQGGEPGLTFRVLANRLDTGAGAIYWHVKDKRDLLTAACDAIVLTAIAIPASTMTPEDKIRRLAQGLFDAMDAHPWIGGALTHAGGGLPAVRVLESLGRQVQALGVDHTEHWRTTSALMSYIIGVGGQNAAQAQLASKDNLDRTSLLTEVSRTWAALDKADFPFTQSVAAQFSDHDDHVDFMAGIELILKGIRAGISHSKEQARIARDEARQ